MRRRYIARYVIEGQSAPGVAVFETGRDGWVGVTVFNAQDDDYVEGLRYGVRLYQRGE